MNTFKKLLIGICSCFIQISLYAQQPNDCFESIVVCGSSSFSLDVNGAGTQEVSGLNSCSSGENNSIWLEVNIETGGTLAFTLTPASDDIGEDYDFFIFGPNVSCSNLGQAIRCSTTNPSSANQGNNLTGMNATSTETSEGPGSDGDSFVSDIEVIAGQRYFIVIDRPIGNSPFSLDWTGTATFPSNPVNTLDSAMLAQSTCDNIAPFDDGIAEFDLTTLQSDIVNGQPNVNVSFHNSESDANININPLGNIFDNSLLANSIFARIENSSSGCYIINEITLQVLDNPSYNAPTNFDICDNNADGDSANGISVFDFSIKTQEITNGIVGNFDISYYLTLSDALEESDALPLTYTNTSPTPITVYASINNTDTGCLAIDSFDINVNPIPEANNIVLSQCDLFGPQDGIVLFNLNEFYNQVTGNNPNRELFFFKDMDDAISNQNIIDPIGYQNSLPNQVLTVKVVNSETQCENFAEIILDISFTSANDAYLSVCDTDGSEDGFMDFDLSLAESQILNGLPNGLNLSFFESLDNALLELDPLPVIFRNTQAFNQTIFVRVENNNDCYGINEIELEVLTLPNVVTEEETLYCLNTFPEKIMLSGGVINDIPNNYYYNWSTGETTKEIEINEPGTYTVTVSNVAGCSKERTITVLASDVASIDNIEVTDVSDNNTITVLVSGAGDYEFSLDFPNGSYQESNVFENVRPGIYTVFVRDINGCGISQENVSVIGFPKFFTPNGDGQNDFWQVKGISSQFQPNTVIYIFDKYGKLLSEINPTGSGWDGNYNGSPMPNSDYWFSVTLEDGRRFSSHFALKR